MLLFTMQRLQDPEYSRVHCLTILVWIYMFGFPRPVECLLGFLVLLLLLSVPQSEGRKLISIRALFLHELPYRLVFRDSIMSAPSESPAEDMILTPEDVDKLWMSFLHLYVGTLFWGE